MKKFNVYMFLNEVEEPLYIGISKNLNTRIEKQHFKSKSGNLTEECILETNKILYFEALSIDDMKSIERYLINTLNPKYNKSMNNKSSFSFSIPNLDWKLYSFDKEELLKKHEENKFRTILKFRNYKYDFEKQKTLKLSTIRTIRTFYTCLLNVDKYYPNIEPAERNILGYSLLDDFHFLKINNELYIFCSEILHHFYDSDFPGDGSVINSIKDIENLRNEYRLDAFVVISCKEKKGIFNGGEYDYKLPNDVLFMKYETLKTTGLLSKEWENLLDKGLINYKKPRYFWLIGRSFTKEEHAYSSTILNEEINRLHNSYKK